MKWFRYELNHLAGLNFSKFFHVFFLISNHYFYVHMYKYYFREALWTRHIWQNWWPLFSPSKLHLHDYPSFSMLCWATTWRTRTSRSQSGVSRFSWELRWNSEPTWYGNIMYPNSIHELVWYFFEKVYFIFDRSLPNLFSGWQEVDGYHLTKSIMLALFWTFTRESARTIPPWRVRLPNKITHPSTAEEKARLRSKIKKTVMKRWEIRDQEYGSLSK